MEEAFSYDQKKALCDRIQSVPLRGKRKEQFLLEVFHLINPEKYHQNRNGVFVYFQKLPLETYLALDGLVSKVENAKLDPTSEIISEYVPYSPDELTHKKGGGDQFRYSNKERSLIKKNRYDKQLKEQSDFFESEFESEFRKG